MDVFSYIFDIGIVFIVFSLIWGFFMLILNLLTLGQRKGVLEEHLLKSANYFFIVTLTAVLAMERGTTALSHEKAYLSVGAIVLFLYLVGKLERQRSFMRVSGQMGRLRFEKQQNDKRVDGAYLIGGLALYVLCIVYPNIAVNQATIWFFDAIVDIKDTPVIGWIITIVGVFFLINLIFRGIWVTSRLTQTIMGNDPDKKRGNDPYSNKDPYADDDGFSDFEVIEDEDEDDNGSSFKP